MSNMKKNYLYQVCYQFLISVLPFITSPYISRVLGADGIGKYSFTYAVITYFKIFAALGIANYGNRCIARVRDNQKELNKTFSSLFCLHALLSLLVIVAYLVYWIFFCKADKIIALVQIFYLVGEMFDINWFFFGLEQFKITVTRNSIIKILTAVSIFAFVHKKSDLFIYVFIMAFGNVISTSAVWFFFPKFAKFSKFSLRDMFSHLKPMMILFFAVIAISVFSYMDKIMIGKLSDKTQLGFYENAWKMIEFPVGFITALGTVMLPKISNLVKKGKDEVIDSYIYQSMRFSMVAAIAIAFGIASIGKEFAVVFWGKDFYTSGILMIILSVTVVLMSWNGVIRTQFLIPRQHDKVYLLAVCTGAVVNFVANYILIQKYAAAGAAVGTVLAYVGICVIQTGYASNVLSVVKYFVESVPYIVIGIIMYVCVRGIAGLGGNTVLGLVFDVCVGAAVFGSLSLIYALAFKDKFILEKIDQMKKMIVEKVKR